MSLCPEYIRETIKTLDKRRKHLAQLEEKRDHLQAEYDAMSDEDKLKHHNDLAAAKKKAHDALLDITNVIGGFIVVEDLAPVSEQFLKINKLSKQLHKAPSQGEIPFGRIGRYPLQVFGGRPQGGDCPQEGRGGSGADRRGRKGGLLRSMKC